MRADFEDRYHRLETEHWWFAGRRDLLSILLREAGADATSRILDVGCSAGATLRRLHADGYRQVVGIDVSEQAVERCRRQGLDNVHVMDGQAPAFPDGSFDVILASDVLEHVADERAAVNAWFRLLRPDGLLVAIVPAFMLLWSAHDEANQHRKRYRLAELRTCLEGAGFRTERAGYWNFLLFLPAAVLRLLQRLVPRLGAAHAELDVPPAVVNAMLRSMLFAENRLVRGGLRVVFGLMFSFFTTLPAQVISFWRLCYFHTEDNVIENKTNRPSGMFGFALVWLGQIVSVLATNMSTFALSIWVFEKTGSATALGVVNVSFIIPFLILSPIAGVWVDRYNRKLMMMVSDLAAVLATVGILAIHTFGTLQIWHLCVAAVINGLGSTFQWPAYSATISTMVPKEQYNRANGMMSLVESGPGVLAPLLAGALLVVTR